ncbi:MAG: hypothetical protein AAGM36_12560 [Cyanobacteria bacterium J06597_1]
MTRFDSPMQAPQSTESRNPPPPPHKSLFSSPFKSPLSLSRWPGAIPEHLAVTGALVPVFFGILLLWNWRFALALLAGSFTMNAASTLQSSQWQSRLLWVRGRLPDGHALSLLTAAAGGTIATLGTYAGLSMLMTGTDRWFTIAAIAQGLVSFGILCLLGLQTWQQTAPNSAQSFDRTLQDIAAATPVTRLLAVQTLNQTLAGKYMTIERRQLALDSLKLALQTETEPSVCQRMQQTLNRFDVGS